MKPETAPLTTLADVFESLAQLSPQLLRATPAMYYQPDAIGQVLGVGKLDRPTILANSTDKGTVQTTLPEGMPVILTKPTDFRKPFEEPPHLMTLPEQYRVTPTSLREGKHKFASHTGASLYAWEQHESPNGGLFLLPRKGFPNGLFYAAMADNGQGNARTTPTHWEHVSVSLLHSAREQRCPTWEEMVWVKNLFWPKSATVVQFHPAEKDYVNFHPYTLHLWRSLLASPLTPDPQLVGPTQGQPK